MTRQEIIDSLRRAARISLDTAIGEELYIEHFKPEYEKGISGHPEASKETHDRSMELYWIVIEKERFAKRMRAEADCFLAAVGLLEKLDD